MKVLCPICGDIAARSTTRYGIRHQCCGLWSWDGKPLADAETHEARKEAHKAFDPLWSGGLMSRTAAYKALADELGLAAKDCHMGLMDAATAGRVPSAVWAILGRLTQ